MKRILALAVVIPALTGGTVGLKESFPVSLGSRTGPTQPIAFNHQVHADSLGMNCLYCHYSADKSPVANIPPVSTCMGCHKLSRADRPEIMKLAGYFERGEQVPWVEVYKLPAHVKFNHKRHVKAGIQCAECHGNVQEMKVVYQATSLKMGWCVTCHRQKLDDPKYPASMDCLVCHH